MIFLRKNGLHINRILPYIIYLIVLLIWHKWANLRTCDDPYFSDVLDTTNPFSFLYERYMTWSSRIGVEFVLIHVGYFVELFRFLDVIINLSVLWMVIHLCKIRQLKAQLFTVGLFLLYNLHEMRSAGWIATMVNYMWVLAALLFLWIVFTKYIDKGRLSVIEWLIVVCLIFFTGTHEQGLIILIAELLACMFSYYIHHNRISIPMLFYLGLALCTIILIAASPGNARRMQMSIGDTDPYIVYCSFFDKIWLGMMRFNSMFMGKCHHIFVAFSICLYIHACSMKRPNLHINRILGAIPLLISILYCISLNSTCFLNNFFVKPEEPFLIDYGKWNNYPPVIISTIVVLVVIYYIYRNTRLHSGIVYIGLFLSAVLSQIMMGFSPTIYRSHFRTSIFLYFAMIIIATVLFSESNKVNHSKSWMLFSTILLIILFFVGIIDQVRFFQPMLTVG